MEKRLFEKTILTERSLSRYCSDLNIAEDFFNKKTDVILDLGAGSSQNLAKECRLKGFGSTIISIDPKLSLTLEEDLSKIIGQQEKISRINSRKNPEPFTIAAVSTDLPFKNSSIDKVVANYSVPYYLESSDDIKRTLEEVWRVLVVGGIAIFHPIEDEQINVVRACLANIQDAVFDVDITNEYFF